MSAAASIALLTLIAQVESAGRTRVLLLDDCPNGLEGFYAPARNRIGLCGNIHSSDVTLIRTLILEATHRLQHFRQQELAAQLDAEQHVNAVEEQASTSDAHRFKNLCQLNRPLQGC